MNIYYFSNPTHLTVPEGNPHSEQKDQDPYGVFSVSVFKIRTNTGGKYQQLFSQRLWLSFTVFTFFPSVRTFGRRAGTWEGLGREGKALGLPEDWVENRQLTGRRI